MKGMNFMDESIWQKSMANEKENNYLENPQNVNRGENNRKNQKKRIDICIIGAGITGITCAYELSKLGYSIAIVEKNQVGSGTTGKTTGKITSQHDTFYNYLEKSFGIDVAKKYLEANQKAIDKIENRVKKENIDCDFERLNSYVYTTKSDEVQILKDEFNTLEKINCDCDFVEKLDLPFNIEAGISFKNQAQFNPLKYLNKLTEIILEKGNKIYTNTIAKSIEKSDDGYIVETDKQNIKAEFVIIASHYPFLKLQGLYSAKMYQSMSYLIAIKTKEKLPQGMYISISNPNISIRKAIYNNEEVLLIGGGDHKTGKSTTYEESYGRLEEFAKKYYPDAKIIAKWNAQDCITLDKIPYIGQATTFLPNVYVATGFKKWGMTLSTVAADIIVDNIKGFKNPYEEIFSSLRMQPIKNHKEMKNMLVDSTNALLLNKLKEDGIITQNLRNGFGGIVEIENRKIGIYKTEKGEVFAVNPKCTHLGCLLMWNQIEKTWDCPCHGSRFDYKGKNICDPAYDDLDIIDLSDLE